MDSKYLREEKGVYYLSEMETYCKVFTERFCSMVSYWLNRKPGTVAAAHLSKEPCQAVAGIF